MWTSYLRSTSSGELLKLFSLELTLTVEWQHCCKVLVPVMPDAPYTVERRNSGKKTLSTSVSITPFRPASSLFPFPPFPFLTPSLLQIPLEGLEEICHMVEARRQPPVPASTYCYVPDSKSSSVQCMRVCVLFVANVCVLSVKYTT